MNRDDTAHIQADAMASTLPAVTPRRALEVTRLGNRHRSEPCIAQHDPRGRPMYWIGPAGAEQDAGPGTDFHAVRQGFISITPIHVDLTRYQALEKVASWVGALSAAVGTPA